MSITGLNPLNLRIGYFLVKNAGSIFLIRRDIVLVGQENLNLYNLSGFEIFKDITTILRFIIFIHGWMYIYK